MIGKNNPLNVRYTLLNRWKGQIGSTKGYCDFSEEYFGVRACLYLIFKSYKKKGAVTYSDIIRRYAPSTENDTSSYLLFIIDKCGVLPFDIPTSDSDWIKLVKYMSVYEGNSISFDVCEKYYNRFKNEG